MAILVVLTGTAAPLFVEAGRPACTLKHHACGQTRIDACCCGEESSPSTDATSVSIKHVTPPTDDGFGPLASAALGDSPAPHVRVRTSPPPKRLDLPTLLATLLI